MLDLVLAIAHHLAIFALFGILAAELISVQRGMSVDRVATVARIDLGYGALAGVIVIVGFARAIFAAKGWAYYSHSGFFWAKISTFVLVALLSIPPTLKFIQWRRRPPTTRSEACSPSFMRSLLCSPCCRCSPRLWRGATASFIDPRRAPSH